MGFELFTIPFTAGLLFILGYFFVRTFIWLFRLERKEKLMILKNIPSMATIRAIREVIMESLLHRKVFKSNSLLGYMHMSLAFGWFLLIIGGNIEAMIYRPGNIHPPYYPIFFRFFEPVATFNGARTFSFMMDLFLLFVLTGVGLAYFKRLRSASMGMKKTTRLQWNDKTALISLWIIFPARLIAESFTSGLYGHGGFITGSLGNVFASFLPLDKLVIPAWWTYSTALGAFFFALPFSRYMHIPTEIVLIFLRNYGIKDGKKYSSFSEIEVHSCSRCGICLDPCPMAAATGINNIQSVYFIRDVRNMSVKPELLFNCLMCGQCNESCPVGIDNSALRTIRRMNINNKAVSKYDYIKISPPQKASVVYFSGCMGQLTPSVTRAMEQVMAAAGEKYVFLDRKESICCGRPLKLAGREADAMNLVRMNSETITASGAKLLVTSCPICYKVFREDYKLDIEIMHHTEYISRLISSGRISIRRSEEQLVYHDPCELGRGSGIYEQPREVIRAAGQLLEPLKKDANSICCGGSLGNTILDNENRKKITRYALSNLTFSEPDQIVTACPMCKKTFAREADIPVSDIAEIVLKALIREKKTSPARTEVLSVVE